VQLTAQQKDEIQWEFLCINIKKFSVSLELLINVKIIGLRNKEKDQCIAGRGGCNALASY
jgi:hypothetical protein